MADLSIFVILVLSGIFSYFNGFVKELFSFLSWVISLIIALFFLESMANLLIIPLPYFIDLRLGAALIILFFASFFLLEWLNYLILNSIGRTQLSIPDRILAGFFCLARNSVIITFLVILAGLTHLPTADFWKKSYVIQTVKPVMLELKCQMPFEIAQQFKF